MLPCFSTSFMAAASAASSSFPSSSASHHSDQTSRRERAARKRIDELQSLHQRLHQAAHSSLRMHNPQSAVAFRDQAVAVQHELQAWQSHLSDLHDYRKRHHHHHHHQSTSLLFNMPSIDPVVWLNVLIVVLVATALAARTIPHDMSSVTHAFVMCVSAIVAAVSSIPAKAAMSCTLRSVSVKVDRVVSKTTPSHWSVAIASDALRKKAIVACPQLSFAMRSRR